ncbi:MAG: dipeptidase [Phycisphaerae bacterium]
MPPRQWFDAHLDLAYLALHGRAMDVPLTEVQRTEHGAALTIPHLQAAGVTAILATVFVQPSDDRHREARGLWHFESPAEAHLAAIAQLDIYDHWFHTGLLQRPRHATSASKSPTTWILMEGCDAIREIDDLDYFHLRGVDVISLTWTHANRWAAGNEALGGITDHGRNLLHRAADLGMILDVSHLAEEAFFEVLEEYPRRIVATHSNARDILPLPMQSPRNLTNRQIRRLTESGGIIGINLYSKFLASGRAELADVVRHIKHVADISGSMRQVGLGSDMDGGFDRTFLPISLQSHGDLGRLADAMADAGFSDDDIGCFAFSNWWRLLSDNGGGPPTDAH